MQTRLIDCVFCVVFHLTSTCSVDKLLCMISCFILITQGSQNVSEEKANHQEDVAGEGISAPERQRREQAKGVRGHAPP